MPYFFKEGAPLAAGLEVELDPEDVKYAYRVLRLRKGNSVTLSDGRGAAFRGVILAVGPGAVQVRLEEPLPPTDSNLQLTLVQGLAKGDKMDLVVRQAVELGAERVVPVVTGRSVPRLTGSREDGRLARWRKIVRAAAAQSRRAILPAVEPACEFARTLELIPDHTALVPWEEEKAYGFQRLLREPLPRGRAVLVFIGPEGGFCGSEIEALTGAGARTFHLGPRILRTETAAAVTLAMVQAAWGDLGADRG